MVSELQDDMTDAVDSAGTKRACDQCRARKIRCDKDSPCSNCRTAQRSCSSTGVGQKPKEARQRVLISTQYERKIDQIEERLGGIERLLRNLSTSAINTRPAETPRRHDLSRSSTLAPSAIRDPSHSSFEERDDVDSPFEGNSSLAAHTAFASEFLEHAVERTSLRDVSPSMSNALSSLRQIVAMQNRQSPTHELRFPHQKPVPKGGLKELPMPPLQTVVEILRGIKESPPIAFQLVLCFTAIDDFTDHCKRVYFATEDFSAAIFIIVNTGLYYLFQERSEVEEGVTALESEGFAEMCRDNLETGLANLNIFMPARKENIEALLLGASWAVELAKPSLAWLLASRAAHLCQTLGYHRASTFSNRDKNARSDPRPILFWMTYMLDKGISLNLGRASTLQDYDITLPRDIGQLNAGDEWKDLLNAWLKHAEIQGNIYEKLYSPTALAQPETQRVQSAHALAAELKLVATQTHLVMPYIAPEKKTNFNGEILNMVIKSDEVSILSSLALVYRALPPPPGSGSSFHPDCIEAAREAMRMHLFCMQIFGRSEWLQTIYLHWTILLAPFIPFIVIFCHIIETSSAEDLKRLADFIASLQSITKRSDAGEKLQRLCQVLYNVAALYVEARGESQTQGLLPLGNEVDMYLSALGFMPSDGSGAGVMPNQNVPDALSTPTFQTSHLGDWFSGGRHMIGVLEEDLMNWSGPP